MSCAQYTPSVYEFIFTNGRSIVLFENFKLEQYLSKRLFRSFLPFLIWPVGLITGIFLSCVMPVDAGFMITAISIKPSWIALLLMNVFPLSLCAAALKYGWRALVYILIAVEAICRGFCGFLIFLTFGSGAWLIRCSFLFSSAFCSILFWWLIVRYNYTTVSLQKDICVSLVLIVLLTVVDRLLVSPFLIDLSMYI